MNPEPSQQVRVNDLTASLEAKKVWEFDSGTKTVCKDVAGQTHATLQSPLGFPSIEAAIVAGDRVALAVDPNVPQIAEVIVGILKTLAMSEAGDIDIVLWDEASDATITAIKDVAGETVSVHKHKSSQRDSLRYLAADVEATPIYLNRLLVDADFVLPVVSSRQIDITGDRDLTGVFPALADSATRLRHQRRVIDAAASQNEEELQIPWLLGVHLIVAVTANDDGVAGEILAGTPDAIRKQLASKNPANDQFTKGQAATSQNASEPTKGDSFPPLADLVIASIDGDQQQQTWANAARALAASSRHVSDEGTIVLWTAIDEPPRGMLARLDDFDEPFSLLDQHVQETQGDENENDFPLWDAQLGAASTFTRVLAEHRVVLRSLLTREQIEPLGVGVIADQSELTRLSQSFVTCGIIRSAQFADGAVDAPHLSGTSDQSDAPSADDDAVADTD
ncbi:hypothetical protein [Planctomycetes bacterium K23_9]|uniref:LarA-like N-terminal domain-containing protein n=1 Tax=Stieleria marina TaxID=1930275 RepID=A0A517NR29_9BACT|nr:hypothetical protein K239x_15260 [Planctomycetes bacterium K23_9]